MSAQAAARMVEALEDWGCHVRAYEPDGRDWWRHTTPGEWRPEGVMHHHTTGTAKILTDKLTQEVTLNLLRKGRPGLPGPLCHGAPAMVPATGTARVWLIGWGNVNHAGAGSSRVLGQVKAGTYAGREPGPDDTDGNPWFWGLEYLHPGDATTWPDALLEQGHRAACALGDFSGWDRSTWPGRQAEHREWTSRKIDRSWRGDVHAAVRRTLTEGTDMALTDTEIQRIAEAVWRWDQITAPSREPSPATNPTWQPRSFLPRLLDGLDELVDRPLTVDVIPHLDALLQAVADVRDALDAHTASPGN